MRLTNEQKYERKYDQYSDDSKQYAHQYRRDDGVSVASDSADRDTDACGALSQTHPSDENVVLLNIEISLFLRIKP